MAREGVGRREKGERRKGGQGTLRRMDRVSGEGC